jgi:hypothetical protein
MDKMTGRAENQRVAFMGRVLDRLKQEHVAFNWDWHTYFGKHVSLPVRVGEAGGACGRDRGGAKA